MSGKAGTVSAPLASNDTSFNGWYNIWTGVPATYWAAKFAFTVSKLIKLHVIS